MRGRSKQTDRRIRGGDENKLKDMCVAGREMSHEILPNEKESDKMTRIAFFVFFFSTHRISEKKTCAEQGDFPSNRACIYPSISRKRCTEPERKEKPIRPLPDPSSRSMFAAKRTTRRSKFSSCFLQRYWARSLA